jgi:L-rhamnose isomerase
MDEKLIISGFEYSKEVFSEKGVDVEHAVESADRVSVSIHSWQGDDLSGFDGTGELTGGIAATGNYPGRATTADQLRTDIEKAVKLIPGVKRLNLHSCHAELDGKKIDRDAYTIEQFQRWVDWAGTVGLNLDFNPTFFSHPMMDGNFSLASRDKGVRKFWIEHGKRCREIAAEFGKQLGSASIVNFWMPDGYKDTPADTVTPRKLMIESLDEIFSENMDRRFVLDAIESKLFGLGVESYTAASHEFSMGYAQSRNILYTLDAGHFHPTETISGKLSAILQFMDEVLLHVSRGVRWDSDHVVVWDDELQNIMNEIVFNNYENRVHIGLDFFDASINRLACWVIGVRNTRKALLKAALTPIQTIRNAENEGDFTKRLVLQEENKSLPFAAVWDYYCLKSGVPTGDSWFSEVKQYEREVLVNRQG